MSEAYGIKSRSQRAVTTASAIKRGTIIYCYLLLFYWTPPPNTFRVAEQSHASACAADVYHFYWRKSLHFRGPSSFFGIVILMRADSHSKITIIICGKHFEILTVTSPMYVCMYVCVYVLTKMYVVFNLWNKTLQKLWLSNSRIWFLIKYVYDISYIYNILTATDLLVICFYNM